MSNFPPMWTPTPAADPVDLSLNAHLTVVQSSEAGMKLDIMHTLSVDYQATDAGPIFDGVISEVEMMTASNETFGKLADKVMFIISPITYNDNTGMVLKEVKMSQELTYNDDIFDGPWHILLDNSRRDNSRRGRGENTFLPRPAQVVQLDLTPYLEEIYGPSIVTSGTYSNTTVAVRASAVASDGTVLAEANYILLEHNPPYPDQNGQVSITNQQVLSLKAPPTPPEITRMLAGDNKLFIKFTTTSATPLVRSTSSGNILVSALVQTSGTDLGFDDSNLEHYIIEGTLESQSAQEETDGIYVINVILNGENSVGNNMGGDILVNGQLYEVSVGVENETGKSKHGGTQSAIPVNLPPRITNSRVETVFTPDVMLHSVMPLVETSFTPTAANMIATFQEETGLHSSTVYWGVADSTETTSGKYQGIHSTYRSEDALTSVGVEGTDSSLRYTLTLAIPRSWFDNGAGGYNTSIDIQARVGQTPTSGGAETFSLPMDLNQKAYLVNRDSIVFDSTGPLTNGIELETLEQSSGSQVFRASITCLDQYAAPTIESVLRRYDSTVPGRGGGWQSLWGQLSLDQSGNSHSGVTSSFDYDLLATSIAETTGLLQFTASIEDPNGTKFGTEQTGQGEVYKFSTQREIQVFAIKNPGPGTGGSGLDVTIHRMGAGEYPRCVCDTTELAQNLNGWSISSMDLRVFTKVVNGSSTLVVNKQNQSLPGILSDQHAPTTSASYSDNPGLYDCEFKANFTPNGMSTDQELLYNSVVSNWNIYYPKRSDWSASNSNTNFYNDPEVLGAQLIAGGMEIQGRTNGSTLQLDGLQSIAFIQQADGGGNLVANQYEVSQVNAGELNVITDPDADIISALQGLGLGSEGLNGNPWEFQIKLTHPGVLVGNENLYSTPITGDDQIFEGVALINPTDAKTAIGIVYGDGPEDGS